MATANDEYLIVTSIQEDGKKLRPSDWVERISSVLASFDANRRLHYSESVQPCLLDGEKCLVIATCLEQTNPAAFKFVMDFARSNRLKVIPDRRKGDRALPCVLPEPQ